MTSLAEYQKRMRQQQKDHEEKERNDVYNEVDRAFRGQKYWHGKKVHRGGGEAHRGPQEGWEEVEPGRYRRKYS
jgi:hypothetical protein